MPTYEYKCAGGHEFTLNQRISDPPIERCKCGKKCKRQLFPVGFRLCGTGWSKDGYSSNGGGPRKKKGQKQT